MNSSGRRLDLWAGVLAVTSLLFPPIAVLCMRWVGPWPIVIGLVVVLLLRVVVRTTTPVPIEMTLSVLAVAVGELVVSFYDPHLAARLYPVFMNATFFIAFGATLLKPPSMIERFARISEPDLDSAGVAYTRVVTWVWMVFFLVNGSIALWTALHGSLMLWGIYNGGISYVAAGTLMVCEYIVRRIVRARKTTS